MNNETHETSEQLLEQSVVVPQPPNEHIQTIPEYADWTASVLDGRIPFCGFMMTADSSLTSQWGNRAANALTEFEVDCANELIRDLKKNEVEGSVMEFEVYTGTWLERLWNACDAAGFRREFYGFDSFEGLPKPSSLHDSNLWTEGMYATDYDNVRRRLRVDERPNLHLVKGWFRDTLRLPEVRSVTKVSYARVDCDLYDSAIEGLNYLGSRLSDNSVLVLDDWSYNLAQGETKAFAEWLPTVPHLKFEFIFLNIWHLYLRVRYR